MSRQCCVAVLCVFGFQFANSLDNGRCHVINDVWMLGPEMYHEEGVPQWDCLQRCMYQVDGCVAAAWSDDNYCSYKSSISQVQRSLGDVTLVCGDSTAGTVGRNTDNGRCARRHNAWMVGSEMYHEEGVPKWDCFQRCMYQVNGCVAAAWRDDNYCSYKSSTSSMQALPGHETLICNAATSVSVGTDLDSGRCQEKIDVWMTGPELYHEEGVPKWDCFQRCMYQVKGCVAAAWSVGDYCSYKSLFSKTQLSSGDVTLVCASPTQLLLSESRNSGMSVSPLAAVLVFLAGMSLVVVANKYSSREVEVTEDYLRA